MTREVRELGVIPEHIKKLFGWEPIAWHTASGGVFTGRSPNW